MTYAELLDEVKHFRVIVVSGPQRSGTTFAAQCIAEDLDYTYIDEGEFSVNKFDQFMAIASWRRRVVIQAPGLTSKLDHPSLTAISDACVVFMHRSVAEIIESQDRIRWADAGAEWAQYGESRDGRSIAAFKYHQWKRQCASVPNFFDFQYLAMQAHDRWVDKADRVSFTPKQTRV